MSKLNFIQNLTSLDLTDGEARVYIALLLDTLIAYGN